MIDLKSVSKLRVLLIGDAIMDEYVYVHAVGKTTKDNALSCLMVRNEVFKGGIWAAAGHVRNLCDTVDVVTGPQMMWNSRMVDAVYLTKLFVTHEPMQNPEYRKELPDIASYDLVIVADFGHGLMTKEMVERVCREAKFLALNVQTNATNYGFNLVTRYPRADLVVLDKLEARLAARERHADIEDVVRALGFNRVIVTMGAEGILGYEAAGGGTFERREAEDEGVVDTMGAGDAVLSMVAPFAAIGVPMHDLLQVGNAAGAAKVGIIGHRQAVSQDQLIHFMGAQCTS